MRHWLAVAALGAAFLALPAWGQRRGGFSGGFAGHAGLGARGPMVGPRPSMTMSHAPRFTGVSRGGFHFVTGFNQPVSSPFFFHHHHRFFRAWPYAGYYAYPYYGYPLDYSDDSYAENSYRNYAAESYPAADYSNQFRDQETEINRLQNEVDRLREQRDASRSSDVSPASSGT